MTVNPTYITCEKELYVYAKAKLQYAKAKNSCICGVCMYAYWPGRTKFVISRTKFMTGTHAGYRTTECAKILKNKISSLDSEKFENGRGYK